MSQNLEEIAKLIFKRKPKKYPVCVEIRIVRFLYGIPTPTEELNKKLEEGEVVLAGCIISDDDPSWWCSKGESVFFQRGQKPLDRQEKSPLRACMSLSRGTIITFV